MPCTGLFFMERVDLMKKDFYLTGKYQNKACRIEAQCHRKTPSIQVELRAANGSVMPITQNLGSIMPPYRCILADGLIGPGKEDFMEYVEQNDLGYIVDYKRFDYDVFTGHPRRLAVVFQFNPKRLRELDPMGCKRYEKHSAKLLRHLHEAREARKAG